MRKESQQVHFKGGIVLDGDVLTPAGSTAGGGAVEPNTAAGVAMTFKRTRLPQHVRLTLTNVALPILAADDYGGIKIVDLPDSNLDLHAIEVDLELVKGGVTNGIVATTDVNIGIGTAVASNATLSGSMIDVLSVTSLTATDASPAYQAHSADDGTVTYPKKLVDASTSALYLNAAASITANDALTVSGTIDLFFLDLGNVTS